MICCNLVINFYFIENKLLTLRQSHRTNCYFRQVFQIVECNLLNLFLSWCVILLIVSGLCFMVSKQYFYLVIGSIILSLSIILLITRLSLCCLKIEAVAPETEAIEMNSSQEPNNSTSTHSQRENKVILGIFVMKGFNRHNNKNNYYLRIEANFCYVLQEQNSESECHPSALGLSDENNSGEVSLPSLLSLPSNDTTILI